MTGLRSWVLVALVVLGQRNAQDRQAPEPVSQEKIDAAIDRGAAFLHESHPFPVPHQVGESALVLYTLLRCGSARDDELVQRLIAVLAAGPIQGTYEAACAIQALSAHDVLAHRRWIEELTQKLITWQLRDGDWAYPAGDANLSTTQYAALGLWTAARDGVAIAPEVWQRLASAVLDYQSGDGGFGYGTRHGNKPYGSMTAAGAGVLAIAEIGLRSAGRWTDELGQAIVAGRERGQQWLAREFSVSTNPRGGGGPFYYLYGLERLGALSGVARFGDHDWYQEGASFLVAHQVPLDGSWGGLTDTCFALLFLKRATAVARSPVTGVSRSQAELHAPIWIASDGGGPVRLWIDGWNRAFLRQVEWPGERGMGPRVTRVEYVVDQRTVAVELGDPDHPARDARFAIEHVFDRPGTRHVRARVFVRLPDEKRGAEHALESQELAVEVERAWPRWIAAPEFVLGPNLLPAARPKVQASSSTSGPDAPLGLIFAPVCAVDDSIVTSWLAAADDERPTLSVTLSRSAEADVIRVSPAVYAPLGVQHLSRPIEIEIEINGHTRQRLAMDPDPLHAMELVLEKPVAIQRLDLSILSIAKSERCPLVGIGEVELFRRER
jgi:hypothetical protein